MMTSLPRRFLFTWAIILGSVKFSVQVEHFYAVTNCVCPEEVLTYECTVCGETAALTVWGGNGFQCTNDEIQLTNRNFATTGSSGACNNGRIVARGLSVEGNNCYTSQLNVTFDAGLQDSTVECSVDDGTSSREVGHDVLRVSTESFPPPQSIRLIGVSSSEMTFSWDQMQDCPSISYNILSNNCGDCPNTTDSASVSCFNFIVSGSLNLCTLMVEVVVCSNSDSPISGNASSSAIVNLTVPTVSGVSSVPHYHIDNGLRRLTVNFSTVNSFVIYNEINGSATSYTITYTDSTKGKFCGSDTVPASTCTEGVCSGMFDISSSLCPPSSNINVTVFATTDLGEGPQSNPVMEEYLNSYVRVRLVSTSINCTFLNTSKEVRNSCNATIYFGENCQDQREITGTNESDNLVSIKLRTFLEETMSSRYCNFIVTAAAGTRLLRVEGELTVIPSFGGRSSSNTNAITAAVLVVLFLVLVAVVIIIIVLFTVKRRHYYVSTEFIPPMFFVEEECNMIEYAKKKIPNYYPDCGKGYYQFTGDSSEYISSKTDVVLISKDKKHICKGYKARKVIGFCDEMNPITLPDLSGTEWGYVFIQCTSRLRMLPQGTHFMFYGKETELENLCPKTPIPYPNLKKLKKVEAEYYKLYSVTEKCKIPEFVKGIEGLKFNPARLGYGFYQFTKPELISHNKQVILMDKNEKLFYGPDARHLIITSDYDESKEIDPPNFDGTRWLCAFVQTRSNARELQPNTQFLHCTVAYSEMVKVTSPFKIFDVEEKDEDKRKLIKFATENIPHYDHKAGYGYYEFIEDGYVLPERNVIAKKKNGELFTGLGVRQLIGAAEDYDGAYEIPPPDFSDESGEWDCIFIQGKRADGRKLILGSRFLYCEYNYIHSRT